MCSAVDFSEITTERTERYGTIHSKSDLKGQTFFSVNAISSNPDFSDILRVLDFKGVILAGRMLAAPVFYVI